MSSKSRKEVIKDNEKNRTVNLHKYRFATFLRYLKETNAEIKYKSPKNDDIMVAYADSSKEGEHLKDLVVDALGVNDGYARDLISRQLYVGDKHYNKEQDPGLGDVLTSIVVQKHIKDGENEFPVPLKGVSYQYYSREGYKKRPYVDLQRSSSPWVNERNKRREFTIRPQLKSILERQVNNKTSGFVDGKDVFSRIAGINFTEFPIFEQETQELRKHLSEVLRVDQRNEAHFELNNELLKLVRVYNEVLDRHDVQNNLIPYYRDFAILSKDELMELCIDQFFKLSREDLFESPESVPLERCIYYRYEIIHLLKGSDVEVGDWPVRFQALLMLCNYELEGIHKIINEVVEEEFSTLRFTIVTINHHDDKRVQKGNLTLDHLTDLLSDYHIHVPLDEAFQLRDNHLLTTSLNKYPEKFAVNYNYTTREVQRKLNQILKESLRQKLFDGQRITEKVRPLPSESDLFQI